MQAVADIDVHAMQAVAEMLLLLSCDSDLIQLYN
jgi:hypothetical protein